MKKDVVVIGAGKIGSTIAELLASTGDYHVTLVDRSSEVLAGRDHDERIHAVAADVDDGLKLVELLNGKFAVLNAAPFNLTTVIAEAARARRTHYLDLTEDVASTRRVMALAADAPVAFIPQCGLAPGFISIVAFDMAQRFETLDSVKLRVGALPHIPSNALNYNLTWSTDGVINEYCEPCEAIVNGSRREVAAAGGMEEFSLDGVTYEAFNTSGGLGTLVRDARRQGAQPQLPHHPLSRPCRDHEGPAQRPAPARSPRRAEGHPGDTRCRRPCRTWSSSSSPSAAGRTAAGAGDLRQQDLQPARSTARPVSAIQITTAAGICAVLDLLRRGRAAADAASSARRISRLDVFLANRFGRVYATPRRRRRRRRRELDADGHDVTPMPSRQVRQPLRSCRGWACPKAFGRRRSGPLPRRSPARP